MQEEALLGVGGGLNEAVALAGVEALDGPGQAVRAAVRPGVFEHIVKLFSEQSELCSEALQ